MRDWKWASICELPAIPYSNQLDLLNKLASKSITMTTFCQEVKRINKLRMGFNELCGAVHSYASRNPSTILGKYCVTAGVSDKNPFDAGVLYVSLKFLS